MTNYWIDEEDLDPLGESERINDYYTEEDYYSPEDYVSEVLAEYEPDMFDDSAELAEGLREVLHDDYQDMPPEELQEALTNILETMTPAEGINFTNVLRDISKAGQKVLKDPTVAQVASTVLPAAGATIGTIYGGPVGAAVGGKLGQMAGQAFSGGGKPSSASAPAQMPTASPKDGPPSAAKIAALFQNEDFLKSLAAAALGERGQTSIPIGKNGPSASVGQFMELLQTLAGKAVMEAEERLGETDEMPLPSYLLDSEGNFDPVDPGDRAERLYRALFDAENQRLADEAELYAAYLEYDDEFDIGDYDEAALEDSFY
jgi:hypothetical protein